MKMIEYSDAQKGYENRPSVKDLMAMRMCIFDWRDGDCPFGRLDSGGEVPAKTVAKYARKIYASIEPGGLFEGKKPGLLLVAEYADKVALREAALNALVKAAKAYHIAGIRYNDFYHDCVHIGSNEIAHKEEVR